MPALSRPRPLVQWPNEDIGPLAFSPFLADLWVAPGPNDMPDTGREQRWRVLSQALVDSYVIDDEEWQAKWPIILLTLIEGASLGTYDVVRTDQFEDVMRKVFSPVLAALRMLFDNRNIMQTEDFGEMDPGFMAREVANILFAKLKFPVAGDEWDEFFEYQTPCLNGIEEVVGNLLLNFGEAMEHRPYVSITALVIDRKAAVSPLIDPEPFNLLFGDLFSFPIVEQFTFHTHDYERGAKAVTNLHRPFLRNDLVCIPDHLRHVPPGNHDPSIPQSFGDWRGSEDSFIALFDSLDWRLFLLTCARWRLLLEITLELLRYYVLKSYGFVPPIDVDIYVVLWHFREAFRIIAVMGKFDDRPVSQVRADWNTSGGQPGAPGWWIGPENTAILPASNANTRSHYHKFVVLGSIEHPSPAILKFVLWKFAKYRDDFLRLHAIPALLHSISKCSARGFSVENLVRHRDSNGHLQVDDFAPVVGSNGDRISGPFSGQIIHDMVQNTALQGPWTILHHPQHVSRIDTALTLISPSAGARRGGNIPAIPFPTIHNMNTIANYLLDRLMTTQPESGTISDTGVTYDTLRPHQERSLARTRSFYDDPTHWDSIQTRERIWLWPGPGSGVGPFSTWVRAALPGTKPAVWFLNYLDLTQETHFKNIILLSISASGAERLLRTRSQRENVQFVTIRVTVFQLVFPQACLECTVLVNNEKTSPAIDTTSSDESDSESESESKSRPVSPSGDRRSRPGIALVFLEFVPDFVEPSAPLSTSSYATMASLAATACFICTPQR
ncbi:hypothetical protein FPV67DRAFT_1454675 [Lyophyllum atratum]|nr:hypothetical protein FPV67DRAFT_1454675 [Lyophyllum atratum]